MIFAVDTHDILLKNRRKNKIVLKKKKWGRYSAGGKSLNSLKSLGISVQGRYNLEHKTIMEETMKRKSFALLLSLTLALSLAGCAFSRPVPSAAPTAEPAGSAEDPAGSALADVVLETGRQNGERFESVIQLEGMEETVQYEHVVSKAAGFEMDYEYEDLLRRSEADREIFLSAWDDPAQPVNYLEVRYDTGNAELVASALNAGLSASYETTLEETDLDRAGRCLCIDASQVKGGGLASQMQRVYIIPASDGCRIATAHYSLEAAEGFGHRFHSMLHTLSVIERSAPDTLSNEQALAAIRNYCLISNPDLEDILNAGEYPTYWEIVAADEQQVVVLFRSYTGAEIRYYIDRATGETQGSEFVPGITPAEQQTEESLNVRDYLS